MLLLGVAFDVGPKSWGAGVLIILLVYVACYSLSISPLFWLMTAELFPNRLRAVGASAATVSNWSANLLISVTFLTFISVLGKSWTFWLYAIFAALAIVFVWRCVPETGGARWSTSTSTGPTAAAGPRSTRRSPPSGGGTAGMRRPEAAAQ